MRTFILKDNIVSLAFVSISQLPEEVSAQTEDIWQSLSLICCSRMRDWSEMKNEIFATQKPLTNVFAVSSNPAQVSILSGHTSVINLNFVDSNAKQKTVFVKSRLIFHCKVQSVHNVGNKQNLKTNASKLYKACFLSPVCVENLVTIYKTGLSIHSHSENLINM